MIDPSSIPIAELIGIVGIGMAFSKGVRYEMLKRDRWTCQNSECVGVYMGIGELNWGRGWNVNGAHYPDMHQREEDKNINNGRCLCVHCHILEEIERGNDQGAMKLWQFQTIRSSEWIKSNGRKDQKPSFFWYMDFSRAVNNEDEGAKEGLAMAYIQEFNLQLEMSA